MRIDLTISSTPFSLNRTLSPFTSALEMSQNSMRINWSFDEVDAKLKGIMNAVYDQCVQASEAFGMKGNLVAGANIAGFLKVGEAMLAQGIV